ncbi:MAG TPA: LysR family transcriptional regulator, partial [Salinarimonas sp.]|nr:LysR family transcriptional regulator [Salinarimonas sp.]
MDWDKIRIFHTVAEAGSFTKAGDELGLSQSAVSRQISALERELNAPLFHRHARGLILTEQGDILFRASRDMRMRLETTRARLAETRERPSGELKVTTTVGLGSLWLTQRLPEFLDLYPEIRVELILTNEELDLAIREAQKNMFVFCIYLVIINFLFLMLGALLYMYAGALGIEVPERTDQLYPKIAFNHLDTAAGIFFVLGLVASTYASSDSALTALTTSFCV